MLNLALIGVGRWGSRIRNTLEQLPGCRLAYVETRDWKKLLSVSRLDGVVIATPASTHAEIAEPFIRRKIATLIEKPLTTSLRDALRLERLAKRSGTPVMVGHVHLYNPAFHAAKRAAQRAGRIRLITAEGMNHGPYRNDSSCLWDWAPHDLASALDLLGKAPACVCAWGLSLLRPDTRLHDAAVLRVRFGTETEFVGTYNWLGPIKRKRTTIHGSHDTVVFDDVAERKVTVYRGAGPNVKGLHIIQREPDVIYPSYSAAAPLAEELRAFLRAIRTRKAPANSLTLGVTTIRILDAAERSIAAGGREIRIAA